MGEPSYKGGEIVPGTQYRIVSLIGAGGYGEVYVVQHTFTEGTACLKILQANLANSDAARRMHIEAKTLGRLAHRNIVEVRDGGLTAEDPPRPYVVMELLQGASLEEMLRRNRKGLTLRGTVEMIPDVLDGLQAAHELGVIHRDLKPANIILHTDLTGASYPKIVDFGIAHLLSGQRVTGEIFLGTPSWAAPEQLHGHRPSPQTDLYSMGLIIYRCLCGRGPFDDRKEAMAIARAHLVDLPPPLSRFAAGVPDELEQLVMMMLAKNPEQRPKSAALVAEAMRETRYKLEEAYNVAASNAADTEPSPMDFGAMDEVLTGAGMNTTVPDAPASRHVTAIRAQPAKTAPMPVEVIDRFAPTPTIKPGPPPAPKNGTDPIPYTFEDNVYMPEEMFFQPPTPPPPAPAIEPSAPTAMAITRTLTPAALRRRNQAINVIGVTIGGCLALIIWTTIAALESRPITHTPAAAARPVSGAVDGGPDR